MDRTDAIPSLSIDATGLDRLRIQAGKDPQGALRGAAQQFEALLLGMMLKSMRSSLSQNTPFDSEQTRMFQSMLDQQFAQVLSTRGTGLADLLVQQLSPTKPAASGSPPPRGPGISANAGADSEFVDRMWPHALQASRETGVPAQFILGQAVLESGWGRAEPRGENGTPSYNLFGIKAGSSWPGPTVRAPTTEYVNGEPRATSAEFRAYSSYGEAFLDYARTLKSQPRYASALIEGNDAAAFARGLQQGGYATDPMYADKLQRVINSAALRNGLKGETG